MLAKLLFISNMCTHARSQPTMFAYPKPSGNIFPATSCPHSLAEMFGLASFRGQWAYFPSFLFLTCCAHLRLFWPDGACKQREVAGLWRPATGNIVVLIGPGIRKTFLPYEPRLSRRGRL